MHDCVYNSVPQITIYFFNSEDISQNEKAKAFFFLVFNDFVFLVNAPLINFSKSNKYLVTMLQLHYHDHFLAFRWLQCLRWMIPPMVVHPEKIDFRRFV